MDNLDYKTLLDISRMVATVRDKSDLLRLVVERVKPLFDFYDCGILVIDRDENRYRDLAVRYADVDPSESNRALSQAGLHTRKTMPFRSSSTEKIVRQMEASGEPLIFDFTADHSDDTDAEILQTIRAIGVKEGLTGLLAARGETIGVFFLNSLEKGSYRAEQFALFQAIVDQVAIAVSNILANEEILEREREKEAMLSIAEAIAAIRNRDELLRFIVEKVQPLLGFNQYAGIMILDEADNKLYNFFTTAAPEELEEEAIQPLLQGFAVEGFFAKILASREPVVKNDSWIHQTQSCEVDRLAAEIWKQLAFKQSVSVSLRSGDRVIGSFHTHYSEPVFFTRSRLRWFAGIADQLAVAVANILANEEIVEQEKALQRAAEERAAKLAEANELLRASVESLTNAESLDRFLGYILLAITEQLGADSSTVWLNDNAARLSHLKFVVERGVIIPAAESNHPNARVPAPICADAPDRAVLFADKVQPEVREVKGNLELTDELRDYLEARGVDALLCVPMMLGGEHLGRFRVWVEAGKTIAEEDLEVVQALANQATLALQLARLNQEAAREAAEAAKLEERNRIAREIHDTLAQSFTGILIQVQAAERLLADPPAEASDHLTRAANLSREGLQEARRSVRALRPLTLEREGLPATLRRLVETMTTGTGIAGEFALSGDAHPLQPATNAALLRICQEALTNAVRHAAARRVEVVLIYDPDGRTRLRVADDGRGFDVDAVPAGFGLTGMRERARQMGAELDIASGRGGTEVVVTTTTAPLGLTPQFVSKIRISEPRQEVAGDD